MKWKFINIGDPKSVVIVHDEESAQVLRQALTGALPGPWKLKEVKEEALPPSELRPVIRPVGPRMSTVDVPPAGDDVPRESATTVLEPAPEGKPQRKSKRYKVRLWVTVMTGAYTFQSATRDVSEGGMALEEKIPRHLFGMYCRIYIQRTTESERVELRCRIFADPPNPRRLKFIDPPASEIARLLKLIEAQKIADEAA